MRFRDILQSYLFWRNFPKALCAALISGWTEGADVNMGFVAICIMSSSLTLTTF